MKLSALRLWTERLLIAAGLDPADADTAAEVFIRASVRGVGHHDIYFLPQRLKLLTEGTINPSASMTETMSRGATKAFEGEGGLGEVCVSRIMKEAVLLAADHGTGFVTVRHSNHFLAASPYVEMASEAGCIGIVWSNTDPCMGGPEAKANIIGNNPMGFAAPLDNDPVMLDIAMAYSSLGKLGHFIHDHQDIPASWGRDAEGNYTSHPDAILNGGICAPMSEHKGYGMAVMNELLTSGLSGGEMTDQIVPLGGWKKHSQSVLAIKIDQFTDIESFKKRAREMFSGMKKKDKSARIPGERSYRVKKDYNEKGITLSDQLYRELCDWSNQLKVEKPDP